MSDREYCLYHGANGDEILSIIREKSMRPNTDDKVFYSEYLHDTFQHGGDLKRGSAFALKGIGGSAA